MPGPQHQQQEQLAPCDTCVHIAACRLDDHRCRAFQQWVNSGRWNPEKRTRPHDQAGDRPLRSVPKNENLHSGNAVSPAPADARPAVQAIDSASVSTSGQEMIASQSASCETQSEKTDEEQRAPNVSGETVTASDKVFLTFEQSRRAHATEYLTRVLIEAGGERQRAAELAGVTRTHMQQLVRRYAIPVPMNPKARRNHRFR